MSHTADWTQVFGSNCLHMALWTRGICHGHVKASECQCEFGYEKLGWQMLLTHELHQEMEEQSE